MKTEVLMLLALVSAASCCVIQKDETLGGQRDEYGCLIAAGYSWNESAQKCMRAWSGEIQDENNLNMPNPAAAYCKQEGYEYQIVTDDSGGQRGECKVNGKWVDEWTVYRNASEEDVKTIGGDQDDHGCYIAAGYSWCRQKEKCVRPWEEDCSDYTIAKTMDESCGKDADCETPGEYLMMSHCPYTSKCIEGKCAVICPFPFTASKPEISSFQECVNAGYPVMESYPRQCRTPDGRTFTEGAEECITAEEYCRNGGGRWNECGNRCMLDNQGKEGAACTMQCEMLCECGGKENHTCPLNEECKKPEGVADALGYCEPTEYTETQEGCEQKGGFCCSGEVCAAGFINCVIGTTPTFNGCDESCNPILSCEPAGGVGLANPASVFCEKQGGRLQVIDTPAGQAGYCFLPEVGLCEEWAYYRSNGGDCKRPDDTEPFCGYATNGTCTTDADCTTGGCSGQVCQSRSEEPAVTDCMARDCYLAGSYGLGCKCVDRRCQWA